MHIIDIFPLLSVIFGVVLIAFILFNKLGLGKNKKIRFVLAFLLFIYVITALDYYLSITNIIPATYSGITYFFYHFTGLLFYYFIALFIKTKMPTKIWKPIIISYTVLRILVFLPFDSDQSLRDFVAGLEYSNYGILVLIEYILVSTVNILLIFFAYKNLKNAPLQIELNAGEKNLHKWIKLIMITIILMQVVIFVTTILGSLDIGHFNFYLKFETLIYAVFFFIFAFSIMHFPIFAYSGNFEDLSTSTI
jgi:hypothetical protein